MMLARRIAVLLGAVFLAMTVIFAAAASHGSTYRVSLSTTGGDPDGESSRTVISPDGNWIVYHSEANNLVVGDRHGSGTDVFATDITSPASPSTVMVSKDRNGGNNPDGDSTFPAVSNADSSGHRYVVFQSTATNLVPGITTSGGNIFRHNLSNGVTELVSTNDRGQDPPGNNTRPTISCDGRYVAFNSTAGLVRGDNNTNTDVYLRDMSLTPTDPGAITRISETIAAGINEDSIRAIIDCSGDHIAFASGAQLVAADQNGVSDIYRWTRGAGVELVSRKNDGGLLNRSSQRPWISGDGNYVVFQTSAAAVPEDMNENHDVYLRNMSAGTTTLVSLTANGGLPGGASTRGVVNYSGRYVAWVANSPLIKSDKNRRRDVYVRDMSLPPSTGIERVSVRSDDGEGACSSTTKSSGDVTIQARPGSPNISTRPTMSADGKRIGYVSGFCTLVDNDNNILDDIFLFVRP